MQTAPGETDSHPPEKQTVFVKTSKNKGVHLRIKGFTSKSASITSHRPKGLRPLNFLLTFKILWLCCQYRVFLHNGPCSLESAGLDYSQETSPSPRKHLSLWQQRLRLMNTVLRFHNVIKQVHSSHRSPLHGKEHQNVFCTYNSSMAKPGSYPLRYSILLCLPLPPSPLPDSNALHLQPSEGYHMKFCS